MKRPGNNWLIVLFGTAALVGCGSSNGGIGNRGSGGSNGSGSGGSNGSGSGGSSGGNLMEVALTVTNTGWVGDDGDGMMTNANTLGVHGSWYPYGDQYGPLCGDPPDPKSSGMKCNNSNFGAHDPSMNQCSVITTPDPSMMSFPNTDGKMCTAGTIAKVIAIVNSTQGTGMDYSNIWGAGIGFDVASDMGADPCGTKGTFAATDKHVVGIKFDIGPMDSSADATNLSTYLPVGLRVEFPMPTTDGTKNGSDYWGATSSYPNSPVMAGTNTIYFDPSMVPGADSTAKGVTPAGAAPNIAFDPNKMEAIQFHVPANTSSAYPAKYNFCISNVKMLVQQ